MRAFIFLVTLWLTAGTLIAQPAPEEPRGLYLQRALQQVLGPPSIVRSCR